MCLILLAIKQHPDYPIILAANRDERYARKTSAMHWWPEHGILAGKDLEAGGTWLGIRSSGRFAALTNFREKNATIGLKSRGTLPFQWLSDNSDSEAFEQSITRQDYSGFNLLYGDLAKQQLFYLSNRVDGVERLSEGLHGLSNAQLNSAWPKIDSAKPVMAALCKIPFQADNWFDLLSSKEQAADELLPDTGVGLASERLLSPRFIKGDDYGTRCSTVLALHHTGTLHAFERSFDEQGKFNQQHAFQWQM